MSDAPSILSFRLTRAYGAPTGPSFTPRTEPSGPVSQATRQGPSANVRNLVAGDVPGGITFDDTTGTASPSRDAIPMYRHPADRNAAAVAIELGRTIDVRG